MEVTAPVSTQMESRHLILKKSFKVAIRSMLSACSKEEFDKAFTGFTIPQQNCLYRVFTQVISSAHENMEDDFESLCDETQVGSKLDLVEEGVEEQSFDLLASQKTNVVSVKQHLSAMKKNEILMLREMLEKAECEKQQLEARIEQLHKSIKDA